MLVYSVISILSIVLLASGSIFVLLRVLDRDRESRVSFVRSFKNGKFILILIPSYFLILIGLYYGEPGLNAVFRAFAVSMKFVVMGFEFDEIGKLMEESILYRTAVSIDCVLIVLNVLMVTLSVFKQKIHEALSNQRFLATRRDIVLIAGYSRENEQIYSTSPSASLHFILSPLNAEEKNDLYNRKIEYLTLGEERVLERILSIMKNMRRFQVCNVIINTADDSRNITLANKLITLMRTLEEKTEVKSEKLAVYVFGSCDRKNLFHEVEEKGDGCFHYVDEYRLAALSLVENRPLSSFFDERHVDYENALLKDIELKVFMIGFGRSNTQLFLESIVNDQFVTADDEGKPRHKAVKYYLFDKKTILENSNLNYSYNRYKSFLSNVYPMNKSDYLSPSPLPAEEYPVLTQDIESRSFFSNLRKNLAEGENDINFISVSLGSDIESIDLANKIVSMCREWGRGENTHVFCRIRNLEMAKSIAKSDIHLWGDMKSAVFNYQSITRKKLEMAAKMHDGVYERLCASGKNNLSLQDSFETLERERAWYRKDRMKRESNYYAALNERTKLALMGIGFDRTLSYELLKNTIERLSPRAKENLMRQEHYRWNAHYIANGYVPARVSEMKEAPDRGKKPSLRQHPNLVEFEALREYEKITGEDVIKYDEMAVDRIAENFLEMERMKDTDFR